MKTTQTLQAVKNLDDLRAAVREILESVDAADAHDEFFENNNPAGFHAFLAMDAETGELEWHQFSSSTVWNWSDRTSIPLHEFNCLSDFQSAFLNDLGDFFTPEEISAYEAHTKREWDSEDYRKTIDFLKIDEMDRYRQFSEETWMDGGWASVIDEILGSLDEGDLAIVIENQPEPEAEPRGYHDIAIDERNAIKNNPTIKKWDKENTSWRGHFIANVTWGKPRRWDIEDWYHRPSSIIHTKRWGYYRCYFLNEGGRNVQFSREKDRKVVAVMAFETYYIPADQRERTRANIYAWDEKKSIIAIERWILSGPHVINRKGDKA